MFYRCPKPRKCIKNFKPKDQCSFILIRDRTLFEIQNWSTRYRLSDGTFVTGCTNLPLKVLLKTITKLHYSYNIKPRFQCINSILFPFNNIISFISLIVNNVYRAFRCNYYRFSSVVYSTY